VKHGRRKVIEELLPASNAQWQRLARQILDLYRKNPDDYTNRLQTLVEDNRL
jgi:hypothetical protein